MIQHRNLLLTLAAALVVVFVSCASQDTDDEQANTSGSAGGQSSIFAAGGTGSGTGSTGNTSGTLPLASQTENGTMPVDAADVKAALADPIKACQGAAVEAEAEPAVLLFLVDVSGSMRYTAPSTNGATKWELTRLALKNAIQGLPANFGVGISFYPNMGIVANTVSARPISACVDTSADVPLGLAGTDHVAKVVSALDGIEPFATAATPTHDAVNLAVEQLSNTALVGRRYIVFITDGQPTQSEGCLGTGIMCQPTATAPIVDAMARAYADHDIKTFVVGSPGSEKTECDSLDRRDWLSQAARAGQTATANCSDTVAPYCHFDLSEAADFGRALTDALLSITRSMLSCKYGVPDPSSGTKLDPALVNMFFSDGSGQYWLLLPDDLGTCVKGWSYTDASKSEVQICGNTCKLLQESPRATLNILFGCVVGGPFIL